MSFPLYDTLVVKKKTKCKKDLPVKNKKEFISFVKEIDTNGAELIYAIIKSYFNNNIDIEHVYKETSKLYSANFDKFPISLKHILIEFMNTHKESILNR